MPWTTEDIPNLDGTVAVVTGANSGLGLESARALAGAGAHVIMAARNAERAETAATDIRGSHPDASLQLLGLDLACQEGIANAAASATEVVIMPPTQRPGRRAGPSAWSRARENVKGARPPCSDSSGYRSNHFGGAYCGTCGR